jgi:pyruvate dehydrogenase E2 component (dihydrolipoamide acetyltransferase)
MLLIKHGAWQGNISRWGLKVGDEVNPGDVLAAIETDKATVDFEMQEEGYIAKLCYPEGAKDVPLGAVIAVLVENKEDIAAFADYDPSAATAAPVKQDTPAAEATSSQPAAQTQAAASTSAASSASDGSRVFVSPYAKKLAEEKGLDLT